jgi:hypothetical protein
MNGTKYELPHSLLLILSGLVNMSEQFTSQQTIMEFLIYFLIIIYIVIRRLKPRKFRLSRMYIWPIIYIILIIFFAAETKDPLIFFAFPILGFLGYLLGNRFLENNEIEFFYNNGELYYKWPYSITVLWSILFSIRIFLEFISQDNAILLTIVDFFLSLNTGLLISASSVTIREAKKYRYI